MPIIFTQQSNEILCGGSVGGVGCSGDRIYEGETSRRGYGAAIREGDATRR
jgi:hypothetical protein